jgi:hypothetical protein
MTKSNVMQEEKIKSKLDCTTFTLSEGHERRFARYCKQQKSDQQEIIEYLIDYAIFKNLKEDLKIEFVRFFRNINNWESDRDELMQTMETRYNEMFKSKDEQYNLMVQQWNDQVVKTNELRQRLAELNGQDDTEEV